jgi:hypothetical protein
MTLERKAQLPGMIVIIALAMLAACFSSPAAASGASLVVTTGSASGIDQSAATLNGQITASGSSDIIEHGFCYGTDPSCSIKVPVGGSISEGSAYSYPINGLTAGTTYYFMAYALNSEGSSSGSPISFTTSAAVTPPTAATASASSIDQNTATFNGQITSNGGADISEYGFCWGSDPSCPNKITVGGSISEGSAYSYPISGLATGTTYYYKAYAANSAGTSSGSPVSFTTSVAATAPTVTSDSVNSIDSSYGTINGTVTAVGSSAITQYGFVYGTTSSCTSQAIVGYTISQGSSFSYQLSGLSAGTTYYYKAYATNAAGTSYGSLGYFTTSVAATAPTVTSDSVSSIDSGYGTINGTVTAVGSSAITQYGFVYGTTSSCTSQAIVGYTISQGSSFSYQLSGLSAGTTYYYKAYATNAVGTSYGSLNYFTTTASAATPTVATYSASDISGNSATLNGYIDSIGGYSITQYGFYYGTTSSCTSQAIVGYSADAGNSFTLDLSSLSEYTMYYYKAYATNAAGTSYGSVYSFTTDSASTPTVTTLTPSVSQGYTTLYGYVTSKGGSNIESYGFYYGTTSSPSTQVVVASDDIDAYDTFSYTLSGLTDGTTYYVMAYATNSEGTSYGSVLSFVAEGAVTTTTPTTTTTEQESSSGPVCVFTIGSSTYSMNGISVTSDVAPYIEHNRTFLPLYTAANALGISPSDISWDGASRTVTVVDGAKVVEMTIGSQQISINSISMPLEVAPEISHGRTCLPVGLISQIFGATCTWNGADRTVTVQQAA